MVFIVRPSGRILSLHVNPNTTTLHTLKQEIENFHGIPISHQRLFFSQSLRLLGDNDSHFISNLGVGNYSTLTLHVPFYGGTQPPDFDKARLLLESAIQTNPKHPPAWIAAARLEELAGNLYAARLMIQKGCEQCPNNEHVWLEALRLANRGYAKAVIARAVKSIPTSVKLWMEASKLESDDINRSRVLRKGLERIPDSVGLWKALLELANEQDARLLLHSAVECCPLHVEFWLALARMETYDNAHAILQEACTAIPNSEEIWLAAFKLEFENHELERARMLLAKARERGGTERVWMKSAIVERQLGNFEEERRLLNEGLKQFPSFHKLWLMLGQLEERLAEMQEQHEKQHAHKMEAKKVYDSGLKTCPNSVPLWLSLSNLEGLSNARAVLTMARNKNPQNPQLWVAVVRAELKHGYKTEADILMANALLECPNSGILWALSIEIAPRSQQKIKSTDAINNCDRDPHVIAAVGKLFWIDMKVDKARHWLNRAVTLAPDIGDFWALCYKFELQHGTEENQKDVLKRCVAAEPRHGEKWQAISKAVENSHQPTESILKKVVIALGKEEKAAEDCSFFLSKIGL